MKKLYILAVFAAISFSISAQTTSAEPTHVVTHLTAPEDQEGVVYIESKYDSQIKINLRNVTPRLWAGSFNMSCVEGDFYDYPYVEMVGNDNGTNSSSDHSFIEIRSLGIAHIEKVEFVMGAASAESKLVCAPSFDGIDFFSAMDEDENYNPVYKNISVAGLENICNASYSYEVPTYISNWATGIEYPEFRESVKYIRLNWGKMFSGTNTSNKGGTANLFAIKIYTNADTTVVGIDEESQDQNSIDLKGQNLEMSSPANVQIVSVSGKVVISQKGVDQLDLSSLQQGVYIVKAIFADGKAVVKKIIL